MREPTCDFCGAVNPPWMFRSPAIISDLYTTFLKAGHFAACSNCATLMESRQIDALVERAIRAHPILNPFQRMPEYRTFAAELRRIFRQILPYKEIAVFGEDYDKEAKRRQA